MSATMTDNCEELRRDGITIVPGVLTTEEVALFRRTLRDYFRDRSNRFTCSNGGYGLPDCFGYVPLLRRLQTHERLLEAISRSCGPEAMLCPHHDVQMNRFSSWHRDLMDTDLDPWSTTEGGESWKLYKCGLYLQPCRLGTRALVVRKGSHRSPKAGDYPLVSIKPKIGDAVIFDQRILHQGQPYNLAAKIVWRLALKRGDMQTRINAWRRRMLGLEDRLAIFLSIAHVNAFSVNVAQNTILRQLKELHGEPESIAALSEAFEQIAAQPGTPRKPSQDRQEDAHAMA